MSATDLQQSKNTPQITGQLGDFVEFKNGRSSPDRTDSGAFAVYGSNGEIGKADVTNAPEGTLVVGRVGSYCGSVHYSPNKCWVTDNAIIGSSRSQKDSRFWFYKLASLDLNNYRAGSGQPLLNQQILNSIQISIPASEDDRFQIARVLAAFDDKIDLNRRINQTLEAMTQAIFKSWFVDFDPVKAKIAAKQEGRDPLRAAMSAISGKPDAELDALPSVQFDHLATTAALFPDEMEESELGEIPREWEVVSLGDYLSTLETGSRPKGGVGGIADGVPSVGAENIISVGNYNFGKEKFVTRDFFEKMKRGKVQNFDFLLYKDGGKPGDFKPRVSLFGCGFPYEEFAINEHVFRIRSDTLGQPFLYFQIGNERVLAELSHKGAKAAIPGINQGDVTSIRVVKPHASALAEFNKIAYEKLELILRQAKESQQLALVRDTLLPKLLSGALSVTEVFTEVVV